jgi:hypothetical protein
MAQSNQPWYCNVPLLGEWVGGVVAFLYGTPKIAAWAWRRADWTHWFSTMRGGMEQIQAHLNQQDESSVEWRAEVTEQFKGIKSDAGELSAKVVNISAKVDSMEAKQGSFEVRLTAVLEEQAAAKIREETVKLALDAKDNHGRPKIQT